MPRTKIMDRAQKHDSWLNLVERFFSSDTPGSARWVVLSQRLHLPRFGQGPAMAGRKWPHDGSQASFVGIGSVSRMGDDIMQMRTTLTVAALLVARHPARG
jgi:hypothetical protein